MAAAVGGTFFQSEKPAEWSSQVIAGAVALLAFSVIVKEWRGSTGMHRPSARLFGAFSFIYTVILVLAIYGGAQGFLKGRAQTRKPPSAQLVLRPQELAGLSQVVPMSGANSALTVPVSLMYEGERNYYFTLPSGRIAAIDKAAVVAIIAKSR